MNFTKCLFTRKSTVLSFTKHINIQLFSVSALLQAKTIFNWEDPLDIEGQLREEEKLIRDTFKLYAKEKLMPKIVEANRHELFNRDIFKELGELGAFGCNFEGYGCTSVSSVAFGLMIKELETVDSSYQTMIGAHGTLVIGAIMKYGTEQQKEKYIPKMVKGELVGCFAISEPGIGSDATGVKTRARYDSKNKCFTLSGEKTWIAWSPVADLFIVWAKDDNDILRGFIVDRTQVKRGLETTKINGKFAVRASLTGNILLDDVVIPEENFLPTTKGIKSPFSLLNISRYGISWGALSTAETCFRIARQYALDRKQFKRPLAANQLIQEKLANMLTEISIGYQSSLRVGRLMDENKANPEIINMLKRNSCEKGLTIARMARDMLGGNGIQDEYHVIRHALNLEAVNTYEGSSDILALALGRAITGISAF